jgi:hypothetical protein
MTDAYFTTNDDSWFEPTDYARGPWDPNACHGGPPTALLVRAVEGLAPGQRLVRVAVDLRRPIPMSGFRVQGELRRPGRSVTYTEAEIFDEDHIYARAYAMHIRTLDRFDVSTADVSVPRFEDSVPGTFFVDALVHDLGGFPDSLEVRFDRAGEAGTGGPKTMWMRTKVAIIDGEEPTPFQKISPLGDCGNGISHNSSLDQVMYINPDLHLSLHRDPVGDWFCSKAVSHWHQNGIGMSDAELFDARGPVGRAVQGLLLAPTTGR